MGKCFEEQQRRLDVGFPLFVGLVEPRGCHGHQAHAVPDEDDDVPGLASVQLLVDFLGLGNLGPGLLVPLIGI